MPVSSRASPAPGLTTTITTKRRREGLGEGGCQSGGISGREIKIDASYNIKRPVLTCLNLERNIQDGEEGTGGMNNRGDGEQWTETGKKGQGPVIFFALYTTFYLFLVAITFLEATI